MEESKKDKSKESKETCLGCFPMYIGVILICVMGCGVFFPMSILLLIFFVYMMGWDSKMARKWLMGAYGLCVGWWIGMGAYTLWSGEGMMQKLLPEDWNSDDADNTTTKAIYWGVWSVLSAFYIYFAHVLDRW